jgi:hypothetical protein
MTKWIIVGVVGLIGLLNMVGYLRAGFGKVRPGGPGFLAPRDKT